MHRKSQRLMPFPASKEFIDELHAGLEATCYCNRSQFIRDAIVEKLERMGIKVKPGLAAPPPRGLASLMLKKQSAAGRPGKASNNGKSGNNNGASRIRARRNGS